MLYVYGPCHVTCHGSAIQDVSVIDRVFCDRQPQIFIELIILAPVISSTRFNLTPIGCGG